MRGSREPSPDQRLEKTKQLSQGKAPALSRELTPMQHLQPPESKWRITNTPITFAVDWAQGQPPSGCLSFHLLTLTLPHGRLGVYKEGRLVGNLLRLQFNPYSPCSSAVGSALSTSVSVT